MRGRILVVDDQDVMRQTLRRVLSKRGYEVHVAHDRASALYAMRETPSVEHAIIDQSLTGESADRSGLALAEELLDTYAQLRVLIHTGWASCDAAFRSGRHARVIDYLPKPAPLEAIVAKLEGRPVPAVPPSRPASLERVEREHLLRVLADHGGNVTHSADALGITRSTLQRKLERIS